MMQSAVVLSGNTTGIGVIRALGEVGVPVLVLYSDEQETGHVSKYATHSFYTPDPVDFLLRGVNRIGDSILIPTDDESLSLLSQHKSVLEGYYTVACPEWEITQQFIDKKHTYDLAEAIGVPAPKTVVPRTDEDVERYGNTVQYPCLVKPSQGHLFFRHFKQKMVKVENFDQMLATYRRAADLGLEVMIQEIIPGDDSDVANYNSYSWQGEPLVEFTAQQIRKAPPEFGSPRVVISQVIPEVIEPGRKILQAMGFYGYSCTEFKKDSRDGVYKLMEVNGRHNRSTLLAVRCGVNFPWIEYKHLVTGEMPSVGDQKVGIYWIDVVRDVGYSVKSYGKERYALPEYLRPYFGSRIFAIFELKDPRPFVKRCTDLVKAAFQTAVSTLSRYVTRVADGLPAAQRTSKVAPGHSWMVTKARRLLGRGGNR
jgi:predicted ATP-grasp superfamily ATP-dependent carboligase